MKIFMFHINGREIPVCASSVDEAFQRATRLYKMLEMDKAEELYQAWNVARNAFWQDQSTANEKTMDEALRSYLRHRERNIPASVQMELPTTIQGAEVYADVCRTAIEYGFETSPEYSFVE